MKNNKRCTFEEPRTEADAVTIFGKTIRVTRGNDTFFVVIPAKPNETEAVELAETGDWPLRISEHLPAHETFLDFLVEGGVSAWTQGQRASNDSELIQQESKGGR